MTSQANSLTPDEILAADMLLMELLAEKDNTVDLAAASTTSDEDHGASAAPRAAVG